MSECRLSISTASTVAALFMSRARRAAAPDKIFDLTAHALSRATGGSRVLVYTADYSGQRLRAVFSNGASAVSESHFREEKQIEGPLALAVASGQPVLVQHALDPSKPYFVLGEEGNVKRVFGDRSGYPLNPEATERYRTLYGPKFEETGQSPSIAFVPLFVPKPATDDLEEPIAMEQRRIVGACRIDRLPEGLSLVGAEMDQKDLLTILSIIGHSASQALDEFDKRMQLEEGRRKAHELYMAALSMIGIIAHDVKGIANVPITCVGAAVRGEDKDGKFLRLAHALLRSIPERVDNLVEPIYHGKGFDIPIKFCVVEIRDMLEAFSVLPDFEIRISNNLPRIIVTDETIISHVFRGLIENAGKYSSVNHRIIITASKETNGNGEAFVRISIADFGIGIKSENLERIFEGGFGARPGIKGLRRGLYGFRRRIEQLGGRIWAESEGEKRNGEDAERIGSTFIFTFPLEEPPHDSTPAT